MKRSSPLLAIVISPVLGFAATNNDQNLHYKNQRGSELNIILHDISHQSGTVTGTFKTAVANNNCREVIGESKDVSGYYTGNAITLSVNYPSCGATVAIAGNFDKNKNIDAVWIVANQGQDTGGENWNTRLIGYDKYQIFNAKSK